MDLIVYLRANEFFECHVLQNDRRRRMAVQETRRRSVILHKILCETQFSLHCVFIVDHHCPALGCTRLYWSASIAI